MAALSDASRFMYDSRNGLLHLVAAMGSSYGECIIYSAHQCEHIVFPRIREGGLRR